MQQKLYVSPRASSSVSYFNISSLTIWVDHIPVAFLPVLTHTSCSPQAHSYVASCFPMQNYPCGLWKSLSCLFDICGHAQQLYREKAFFFHPEVTHMIKKGHSSGLASPHLAQSRAFHCLSQWSHFNNTVCFRSAPGTKLRRVYSTFQS